jgi:hypothetical protein
LTDFGLSNCIKEVVGQPTSTYCEGTFKTMSPEMQRLNLVAEGGMVDLYFNDYWGVRVTLREAKKMSTVPISVEDLALSLELSEPGQSN